MKNILMYSSALFLFLGCVESFDLELDKAKPRLVIQGLIENNAGPHYIRITQSNKGMSNIPIRSFENGSFYTENEKIIEDATVIISDDTGQEEQLTLLVDIDEYKGKGFYKTTNFIGVVGRTYSIKVTTKEGEIYEASDYMHPISEIESIKFEKTIGDIGKPDDYAPILYFKDPQENEENRYLIQFREEERSRGNDNCWCEYLWRFAILSDKYFHPEKTGVSVDNGVGPNDFSWSGHYHLGMRVYIRMNSLSDQSYTYYRSLLEQFQQDGGAYKPSPASPPTNISNGGLGFFRASAFVEVETIAKE